MSTANSTLATRATMIGSGFLGVKAGVAARGLNTTVTMRGTGPLGDAECDGLSEGETLIEIEDEGDDEGESERDSEALGDSEAEVDGEGDRDSDSLAEGDWLADGDCESEALKLGD